GYMDAPPPTYCRQSSSSLTMLPTSDQLAGVGTPSLSLSTSKGRCASAPDWPAAAGATSSEPITETESVGVAWPSDRLEKPLMTDGSDAGASGVSGRGE